MDNEANVNQDPKPTEPLGQQNTAPSDGDKPEYSRNQVNDYLAASQSSKDKELVDLRAKAVTTANQSRQLDEANAELARLEGAKALSEQDAVKDDPEALAKVRERQALDASVKQKRQELATVSTEVTDVDARNKAANDFNALVKAAELAKEHQVDVNQILSFNPTSPEEMERIAKGLKGMPAGTTPGGDKHKRVISPIDAGAQSWRDLSAEDKILKGVSG